MKKNLLSIFAGLLSVGAMQAQLDPTFGVGGKVVTNVSNATFNVTCQALQSDGKIVMAGHVADGHRSRGFVCRVNADGSTDTGFNGGNIINEYADHYFAVAVQTDGKIVVGGGFDGEIAMARYNNNGTLDTTFDDDGLIYTPEANVSRRLVDVAIQTDGKIVALTEYANSPYEDYRLMRFTTDGFPDTSFDGDGTIVTNVNAADKPVSVTLQGDGKILVGGYTLAAATDNFFITRHNANGSLDTSFNSTGKKIFTFTNAANLYDVAVQPDGKIVYNGRLYSPTRMITGRINANGTTDNTFGTGGNTTTAVNIDSSNGDGKMKIQPDGKIFAINRFSYSADNSQDVFMIRYNANGSLDATFDGDGSKIFSYGDGSDFGRDFDIIGTKILISGNSEMSFSENRIAMARFNADGSLDATFDDDGTKFMNFIYNSYDAATAMALQTDGKIIVGGVTLANDDYYGTVLRYNPDGTLDTAFGNGGKVILPKDGAVAAVAIQTNGKIIAGGSNGIYMYVFRLNTDGSLDTTFDSSQLSDDFEEFGSTLNQMKILSTGKILIAGRNFSDINDVTSHNYFLARLNSNGSIDTTFGVGGYSTAGSGSVNEEITALKILADGKILAGGSSWGTPNHYTLLKYTINGALDTSFANGGVYDGVLPEGDGSIMALDTQSDGKILAGLADNLNYSDANYKFIVMRFNANGTIDNAFGSGGRIDTDIEGESRLADIKVLSNQKFLVSGTSYGDNSNFALAKYNSDGTPDTTFAPDGIMITDFSGTNDKLSTSLFTADNRILTCGYTTDAIMNSFDHALAKFGTDGTLGLVNPNKANTAGFYPNPADDKISFSTETQSASLFTLEGKLVKSMSVTANQVNLSELSDGIYLLRYTTKDGSTKTEKLIKK
ncbi:T9SS type A sorting domain-containing protein [Flavobacterium caeni]|uniref:Delta-60 repeat domain-containing protein/Por secretion system C-terminal sorting domain-containing protein n=1 Tax=Flavobacterium caeni TaxID=490189 RepID=A0A1G5CN97_9FLAO|nr:T9SS type A sorting domain-containing protein [Flavobacterium caeni]SCY03945.1 delta-60 repeat domain-containing protein/Por secretion system C-terminal sorting domain-containing protein [Flavobacterium caeni]